ncbi:MAG: glycosyltransferase WbuB [Burkholderiales bacterium PBB4]|nr:MAG: glycosyltransferase WbuB [Burkholderiales bacterium PBB4]
MRLLVVTQYFWPENFRINELVAELVRCGYEVTVLTGYPNYPDGEIFQYFREAPAEYLEYQGAVVVRVPLVARGRSKVRLVFNYFSFALSASILGIWRLRGRKFDAIFAYEPSPITVGLPAIAMKLVKRAPLAFWVLDLWPETLQALGVVRSAMMLRCVGRLVSFIYQRCDLILAQSRSFIPEIQKYSQPLQRVEYFPNWTDAPVDARGMAASEVPLKPGCFTIMFAGNIGEAQDFPAILAAAEVLRSKQSIRWLIVGDGRLAEWVAKEIKARQLDDCVLMLGRYPAERMPEFFRHADALLVSLKKDSIFAMTIPGKLQAYLATGKPIIAMLDGEGANLVECAQCGVTCPAGHSEKLAAAVLELSGLPDVARQKMGQNGIRLSALEFDRDILISGLNQSLLSMIKQA